MTLGLLHESRSPAEPYTVIRIRLTDYHCLQCHPPGMELSKMTLEEVQALLRLLAEFERDGMELLMQEQRKAELKGRLH